MAVGITDETIARIRSQASAIPSLINKLTSSGEEVKGILRSNGNYQYFRMGTDKGATVDTSINDTVNQMVDKLVPTLNSVLGAIESYCATQAELNRLERMKKGETGAGDILGSIVGK